MALKDKYQKDKDSGIKNLREIKNSPVSGLTDEEIAKLFFDRFGAEALVMLYMDKQGLKYSFGRLRVNKKTEAFIERINLCFQQEFGIAENWKELE